MVLEFLAYALFPVVLLGIVAWRVTRNGGEVGFLETSVLWFVFVILWVIALGGLLPTRELGQISAIAITMGLPLICAAFGARVGRRSAREPGMIGRLAFAFGLLPAVASPLILVVVGCVTDECF